MRTLWQIVEDIADGSLSRRDGHRALRALLRAAFRRRS